MSCIVLVGGIIGCGKSTLINYFLENRQYIFRRNDIGTNGNISDEIPLPGVSLNIPQLFKIILDDLCSIGDQAQLLKFKELTVPTLSILKEDYRDLFDECERHSVKGFLENITHYSVVLYLLNHALKVLNIFGHPSERVREKLCKGMENLSSFEQDLKDEDNSEKYANGNDISRLCLYDLRAMLEALGYKRLKVMSSLNQDRSQSNLDELKKLECKQKSVIKRMQEIDSICLKYSEHTA